MIKNNKELKEDCSSLSSENQSRESWKNKREYLLSCIGYAVGLGNIWRFPYLCFQSGGGGFLIPYFVTLFLLGIPLLYLELAVGQLTQVGPVHAIAAFCPLFKGVGVATVVMTLFLATYYNIIIAWALYYLFNSFSIELPWYSCHADWSSVNCSEGLKNNSNTNNNTYVRSPIQDFFDNRVLGKSSGIEEMGGIKWDLFACFAASWIICYFGIFKGVKSVGKVAHVTVILPYFLLLSLLFVSCQLPGATNGLLYFIRPRWGEIFKVKVWVNAAAQNFNSIGIAFGAMIAFSSYNKRIGHLWQDTMTIASVNCMTSLISGTVIFSAMGHMAYLLDTKVEKVVKQGPELVFILYPQIFVNLPAPPIWSILFFLTLIMLGIDSQFGNIEVIVTTLADSFNGRILKSVFKGSKKLLSLFVCVVTFLLGLPNVFKGGIYFFTLIDKYDAIIALMFIALFEVIALCWVYGAKNISNDLESLTGKTTSKLLTYNWIYVSPLFILVLLIFTVTEFEQPDYGEYEFPIWALVIGWLITASSLVCIPIYAVLAILDAGPRKSLWQKILYAVTPQPTNIALKQSEEML